MSTGDRALYNPSTPWLSTARTLLSVPSRLGELIGFSGGKPSSDADNLPISTSRRRPITPDLSKKYQGTTVVPNGIFFERLVPELRRKILVEVFGNLPIHIDLEYAHPPLPGMYPIHADFYSVETEVDPRDPAEPERWQWRSSVCHRNPPIESDNNKFFHALWTDQCLGSRGLACHIWPGEFPSKCRVSAMGWLRSCRQAYVMIYVDIGTTMLKSSAQICRGNRDPLLDEYVRDGQ
jgi:hypothetical protein